jgi:hypothetical protein
MPRMNIGLSFGFTGGMRMQFRMEKHEVVLPTVALAAQCGGVSWAAIGDKPGGQKKHHAA